MRLPTLALSICFAASTASALSAAAATPFRPRCAPCCRTSPIVAMAQSNAQTQLMGVGGPEEELGRSVLVGVEAEEDRSWRNATPSRMLGSVRSPRLLDQLRRSLRSPVILCSWRLVTG